MRISAWPLRIRLTVFIIFFLLSCRAAPSCSFIFSRLSFAHFISWGLFPVSL